MQHAPQPFYELKLRFEAYIYGNAILFERSPQLSEEFDVLVHFRACNVFVLFFATATRTTGSPESGAATSGSRDLFMLLKMAVHFALNRGWDQGQLARQILGPERRS